MSMSQGGFGEYEYEAPYGEAEREGPYGEAEDGPYGEAQEQFLRFHHGRRSGFGFGGGDDDGRRRRRGGWGGRRRWREAEYEGPYGEAEDGPYGEAEDEGPYGEAEGGPYGEAEDEGPYGEAEDEGPYGEGEGVFGEGEEQFLPALIPIVGSLLGGLFKQEAEGEYEGGYGEAEEQFLGKILGGVLGEAGRAPNPLSPAQEARLASELLEVSSEEELEQFLQGVVNTVSRAYRGARDFAASPTGRAVIDVVKPVAKACRCRQSHPHRATRRYSLIVPPARVCLRTRYCPRTTGCGSGFSGAAESSDRCGRC